MSRLRLNKVTTPSNPAANKAEIFYDSSLTPVAIAAIDENGNIVRMGGFTTKDYRLVKVTNIFQGTTTYTPTSGVAALYVECIGAGGSGGGGSSVAVSAAVGGGGGGGAYSAVWSTSNVSGAHTVQVGAGGSAPSAGNNPGNAGTDTFFKDTAATTICLAKAGSAGSGEAGGTTQAFIAGGAGGVSGSGTGDIKLDGVSGGTGNRPIGTAGVSGRGGNGPFGGAPSEQSTQGNGTGGGNYGAGGSGGCTLNGGSATAGGAGANGLIRVWEFA